MIEQWRKNQYSKMLLVFVAIAVLAGGVCLAGKPSNPGGGGTQPQDFASLSTVMDPTGGLRQNGDAYIDGAEGVRSVIAENTGYQFMSAYKPYDPPRTAYVDLTGEVCGNTKTIGCQEEQGEQVFTPPSGPVPLHLGIMWNIWDLTSDNTGPMGGSFDLNGKTYYLRFSERNPNTGDWYGASPVQVTRTSESSWTVESTSPHTVRLLGTGKRNSEINLGLYYLPFKLTLTVTQAYKSSTQKSFTPEDIFTWSPQGDRIARIASDPNGDHTIQVIDLQTGSVLNEYGRGILTSAARGLAWANRGEMLAFSASSFDGRETVFILNLRNTGLMEIGKGWAPRWAPDDSRLVYLSEDGVAIFDLNRRNVITVPGNSLD